MTRITVLGMGAMGSRVTDRLEAAGHDVTRWNRTGADKSPREAVTRAEVVIAMLRDDDASRSAWLDPETGALRGLAQDAVAIESSTLTQATMTELGAAFAAGGKSFLEAPVLGSRPQAEAGQLITLVGGDPAVFARVEPLLDTLAARHLQVGPIGSATALKLAANALFGVQVAFVAELLGRMRSMGLDPAAAIELLAGTPQLSPAAQMAARLMLAGKDDPLFPVELVAKDFAYAIGDEGGAMPLASAALAVFRRAAAEGLADANLTAVHRLYEGD